MPLHRQLPVRRLVHLEVKQVRRASSLPCPYDYHGHGHKHPIKAETWHVKPVCSRYFHRERE